MLPLFYQVILTHKIITPHIIRNFIHFRVISHSSDLGNVIEITSVVQQNNADSSAEVGNNCENTDTVEAVRKVPKDLEAAFPFLMIEIAQLCQRRGGSIL